MPAVPTHHPPSPQCRDHPRRSLSLRDQDLIVTQSTAFQRTPPIL